MNKKIKRIIEEAIEKLISHTSSEKKINSVIKKHENKMHFIPIRYRVLGGLLQSLNIQFGNYIEELMHLIVENEKHLAIHQEYSGKKNTKIQITKQTDALINKYITDCQSVYDTSLLPTYFNNLIDEVIKNELSDKHNEFISFTYDIDVLFEDVRSNNMYYIEIKYNDDHDTGKYVDINRKFLKTYAGLINALKIPDKNTFKPILYYLNDKIMKGNIYVPELTNIYRGNKLFNEFFTLSYDELDKAMISVGNDDKIMMLFDKLYKNIRYDFEI